MIRARPHAALILTGALLFGGAVAVLSERRPNVTVNQGCGYYMTSGGSSVPRPCGNWHTDPVPQGATARCNDGTYSFSRHPHYQGTCSYHAGVASYI